MEHVTTPDDSNIRSFNDHVAERQRAARAEAGFDARALWLIHRAWRQHDAGLSDFAAALWRCYGKCGPIGRVIGHSQLLNDPSPAFAQDEIWRLGFRLPESYFSREITPSPASQAMACHRLDCAAGRRRARRLASPDPAMLADARDYAEERLAILAVFDQMYRSGGRGRQFVELSFKRWRRLRDLLEAEHAAARGTAAPPASTARRELSVLPGGRLN
jgi:hypothetical protein